MDDREMLEKAAKAAGAKQWSMKSWPGICLSDDPECLPFEVSVNGGHKKGWNPLADDGDALRLAVNLGISIGFSIGYVCAESEEHEIYVEYKKSTKAEATRRAITSAAAEMAND